MLKHSKSMRFLILKLQFIYLTACLKKKKRKLGSCKIKNCVQKASLMHYDFKLN